MIDLWSGEQSSARAHDAFAHTVDQLAYSSHARAVEIADEVLRAALRAPQRSLPIRANPPWDFVHVSDRVLINALRTSIDDHLAGAAVGRIHLDVERDEGLTSLTIELFVQFGLVLMEVGDHARHIAATVLDQTIGRPDLPVRVTTTHVHISDVTAGDPHLMNPGEDPA